MRYGCVSPTPEMEDPDHSDSQSSDASFEIVSAEGIDDYQTTPPSFKPCIKFHDIFDLYPMDADLVARVSASNDFKMSSDDKVVVVPLAWSSVDQAVCVSKLNGFYVRFDVNELPKAPADQFYQLCYCTAAGSVVGVSTPFFFREVHEEDLMEFQKEQNKEFWTFRSRFAVLTDLYWNAVKNNGTTRPDEMRESRSAKKNSRPDEMSGSCSDQWDSDITEKSLIESCSANVDAETVDKPSSGGSSSIQDSVTSEKSLPNSCPEDKAFEITDEPSVKNFNEASETTEKSPAENCDAIKDSESVEKASAESICEKSENAVQSPVCVDQESTIVDSKISESSEKAQNINASQMESKIVTEPTDCSAFNAGPRSKDGYTKRFLNVGPWKLFVNDSFYHTSEQLQQDSEWMRSAMKAKMIPNMKCKIQDSHTSNYEWLQQKNQRRFAEYYTNKGMALMGLMKFRALPEAVVGKLILEAMNNIPTSQLEKDQLLCEARRQTRYDEWLRKNGVNARTYPMKPTKELAGPVSQTILSLTSRIESQAILLQDLRMQLANESKMIETVKGEYQTYKVEMETRLKHCAKEYAKMCLKLRHHLKNEGLKNT